MKLYEAEKKNSDVVQRCVARWRKYIFKSKLGAGFLKEVKRCYKHISTLYIAVPTTNTITFAINNSPSARHGKR